MYVLIDQFEFSRHRNNTYFASSYLLSLGMKLVEDKIFSFFEISASASLSDKSFILNTTVRILYIFYLPFPTIIGSCRRTQCYFFLYSRIISRPTCQTQRRPGSGELVIILLVIPFRWSSICIPAPHKCNIFVVLGLLPQIDLPSGPGNFSCSSSWYLSDVDMGGLSEP